MLDHRVEIGFPAAEVVIRVDDGNAPRVHARPQLRRALRGLDGAPRERRGALEIQRIHEIDQQQR